MNETLGHTLGGEQTESRSSETAEAAHLVVALECDRPLALPSRHALVDVGEVFIGRGSKRHAERINIAGMRGLQVSVPDRWMSSRHARIEQSLGRWLITDAGSKNGTRVNGEVANRRELRDGDVIECGHTLFLFRDRVSTRPDDPPDLEVTADEVTGMTTLALSLAWDLARLRQLAPSPVAILLLGESGTGKEVVARALAELSRRAGEFVAVNCGAIPDSLIESELFGYKKGAFSGASADHDGLVRAADNGTLFLDEVADLPAPSQAALLRVLQEREVRPVGSTRSVSVDIRLVSATHKELPSLVDAGHFRNDLYARISGYRITLPPLRQRREDLGLLVGQLLRKVAPSRAETIKIDVNAALAMFRYGWPLNIRELENALTAAVVLADDDLIRIEHLPEPVREPAPERDGNGASTLSESGSGGPPVADAPLTEEQASHRAELCALFERHDGNVSAVARECGKDRKQIQRWIKRYRIDVESYRR